MHVLCTGYLKFNAAQKLSPALGGFCLAALGLEYDAIILLEL